MFLGPVYMGRYTPIDVLFDTATDWLAIQDERCESCESDQKYVATGNWISSDEVEIDYGSVLVKGYTYSDLVCLQLNACVNDFPYFAIIDQKGLLAPIAGLLGLARGNSYFQLAEGEL